MPMYELLDKEQTLDAPVLVAALEGWVDAGAAGTAAGMAPSETQLTTPRRRASSTMSAESSFHR